MTTPQRELPITPIQAQDLTELQAGIVAAQDRMNVACKFILGGHGLQLKDFRVIKTAGTPEQPTIVIADTEDASA